MYAVIKDLILPPADITLVLAVGLLLAAAGRRKLGWALAALAAVALYGLSTPYGAAKLSAVSQVAAPLSDEAFRDSGAKAIVVLAAGFVSNAPEYGSDTVDQVTLERLRYAAHLHRITDLPILVSGGQVERARLSLAAMMKRALEDDFGVPVAWTEDRSLDTHENAVESAKLLRGADIDRVVLVTHAAHMPRAVAAFTAAGIFTVAAPTGYPQTSRVEGGDFIPRMRALNDSYYALYEMFGRWYATLRYPHPSGA